MIPTLTAPSTSSPYPFAAAPDIIRSHQKDAYFTGTLTNTLSELNRRLLGARSAHAWASETHVVASLLYFSLTTLAGSRTLGEEYTDVVQLHVGDAGGKAGERGVSRGPALPSVRRRAAYIVTSVLLPYVAGRTLPSLRRKVRALLEARLQRLRQDGKEKTREARIGKYLLAHLGTITSAGPVHALALTVFYFSGTYYELSKRLLGLRYVFTRKVPDTPDRAGYEVLGALLLVQLLTQTYLHIKSTLSSPAEDLPRERTQMHSAGVDVSRSDNHYSDNNQLLPTASTSSHNRGNNLDLSAVTNTPTSAQARYNLEDEKIMGFIKGKQQRKCTLCLEPLRDPAATSCGHIFCWECIGDWVREKPECPLCRREAMLQHILPLRVVA